MALSIKNDNVEELLASIIALTGETKTEAIRKALEERLQRLALQASHRPDTDHLIAFLAEEIWSQIPAKLLGTRLSKAEEEAILGYNELGI